MVPVAPVHERAARVLEVEVREAGVQQAWRAEGSGPGCWQPRSILDREAVRSHAHSAGSARTRSPWVRVA